MRDVDAGQSARAKIAEVLLRLSESLREELSRYQSSSPCPACQGFRLKPEALAVKDESGTRATSIDEGYELKGEFAAMALEPQGLHNLKIGWSF